MLSAASSVLFAPTAHAQEAGFETTGLSTGGGIFIGYTFGEHDGLAWGVEAFATHRFNNAGCYYYPKPRAGLGPLVQLAFKGLGEPRLTLALQGGSELDRSSFALIGELGASYRFGEHAGFGVHTGFTMESMSFNVSVRPQWLLGDVSTTLGVRYLPTFGDFEHCEVVGGRPLRGPHGPVPVRSRARRAGESPRRIAAQNEAAERAGRGWERDAQYECASVPAFLQLAAELLAHDAPHALVERALDAARDEIVHAELCAEMASRYLGEPVWPVLPEIQPRAPLAGSLGLMRLATESWIDGCLSEGAAARSAARAAVLATDPIARAAQSRIARDEARHAALGWSILTWAVGRGGAEIADAVRALRDVDVNVADADGEANHALQAYGRLNASEINASVRQNRLRSRDRLDAEMGVLAAAKGPLLALAGVW